MAGFLTYLLEGQNIAEMNAMARDGDVAHLGVVGRNLTLISIQERVRAQAAHDLAVAALVSNPNPVPNVMNESDYMEQQQRDRIEAMELTGFKTEPKLARVAAIPDSDEAVDDFLNRL